MLCLAFYRSPQLAETVWYKVGMLRRAFANNPEVQRCTFLDSDTLIVRPDRSLESIFMETYEPRAAANTAVSSASSSDSSSTKDLPRCSVYLQIDPMLLNAGFVSLRRTQWVLESFLPTWQSFAQEPRFYFRESKAMNYHAPEQAALVAAVLHFVLRSLAPREHPLIKSANTSLHACASSRQTPQAVKDREVRDYFAKHSDLPPKALRHGSLTFHSYLGRSSLQRPTHRLYMCAAYLLHSVIGLRHENATTLPIDDENAICFLGYQGRQINRHHLLPEWFLSNIANGTMRPPIATYGNGISRDLLLIHQKSLSQALCQKDWLPPDNT